MHAENWVPELVEIAGGTVMVGEPGRHSGYFEFERMLEADPDVIAVMPCGFDIPRTAAEMPPLAAQPGWSELSAVRSGRVFLTDGNQYFNRPGPRDRRVGGKSWPSFCTRKPSTSVTAGPAGRSGLASRKYVDGVGLWCVLGLRGFWRGSRGRPASPTCGRSFSSSPGPDLPVFGLFLHFRKTGEPFPVGRLLFWAVGFRLCGLIGGPFYEDDFYRYLWDGYRFATAGTPYGAAPEEFFIDPAVPAVFQGVLDGVNYPELPTIYAPVTQLLFLVAYWIKPASVAVLQAILITVDLIVVALLLRLAPARNVLLYAWCPLVVKEIAFTAHPDGVGVCLLLAAVVLARRSAAGGSPPRFSGWPWPRRRSPWCWRRSILLRARLRHWLLFVATAAAVVPAVRRHGRHRSAGARVSSRGTGSSTRRSSGCSRRSCRRSRPGFFWACSSPPSGAGTAFAAPATRNAESPAATGCSEFCCCCRR